MLVSYSMVIRSRGGKILTLKNTDGDSSGEYILPTITAVGDASIEEVIGAILTGIFVKSKTLVGDIVKAIVPIKPMHEKHTYAKMIFISLGNESLYIEDKYPNHSKQVWVDEIRFHKDFLGAAQGVDPKLTPAYGLNLLAEYDDIISCSKKTKPVKNNLDFKLNLLEEIN